MPLHPVPIQAPADNDCFFHVVAYFLGRDICSAVDAKQARRAIAEGLAKELLADPFHDLDVLTIEVLYSNAPPRVELRDPSQLGATLRDLHRRAAQAHRDVPKDIVEYIVWVQFSAAEVESFSRWYPKARQLFKYTLWGDDLLAAACVEAFLRIPVAIYTKVADRVPLQEQDVVFLPSKGATGAEHAKGREVVNLLHAGTDNHFDGVLFYDVEEQQAILQKYEVSENKVEALPSSSGPVSACPYKLQSVVILDGDDRSGNRTLRKHVNLPATDGWCKRAGASSLDALSPRLRVLLVFENAAKHDRRVKVELVAKPLPAGPYRGKLQRLPYPDELGGGHYGWMGVESERIASTSSNGMLRSAAHKATVPCDRALMLTIGSEKEVVVDGLFLPACGGIGYQVVVTDALGTEVGSTNVVETHRTLFVQYLVGESIVDQGPRFEKAHRVLAGRLEPLFIDLQPLPQLELASSEVSEEHDQEFQQELRHAVRTAEEYSPYFFNVAFIESFIAVRRSTVEEHVFLGDLAADEPYHFGPLSPPEERVQGAVGSAEIEGTEHTLHPPPERTGFTDLEGFFIRPSQQELAYLCKGKEDELQEVAERVREAHQEYDRTMRSDGLFQSQLETLHGRAKSPQEREELTRGLEKSWKEDNRDLYKGPVVGDHLFVTLRLKDVAFPKPSDTGGYSQASTKSIVIPIERKDDSYLADTLTHEVGHTLDLAPGGLDTGRAIRKTSTFYDKRGHQGPHCHFGVPLVLDYSQADVEGRCIMFGSNMRKLDADTPLCDECASAVLRSDYCEGFQASSFGEWQKIDHGGVDVTQIRELEGLAQRDDKKWLAVVEERQRQAQLQRDEQRRRDEEALKQQQAEENERSDEIHDELEPLYLLCYSDDDDTVDLDKLTPEQRSKLQELCETAVREKMDWWDINLDALEKAFE